MNRLAGQKRTRLFLYFYIFLTGTLINGAAFNMSSVSNSAHLSGRVHSRENKPSLLGRFGGYLGGCANYLGKAACHSLQFAAKYSFQAARFVSRPHILKVEASLAGLGALYGVSKTVLNRARIYENMDQLGVGKMPGRWSWLLWAMSNNKDESIRDDSGKIKIYNWRIRELNFGTRKNAFPTASTILNSYNNQEAKRQQHHRYVIGELIQDSGLIDIQSNYPVSNPKARILDTIEVGLKELHNKLDELSKLACFPSRKYDRIGIEKIINDCCKDYVEQKVRGASRVFSENEIEDEANDMRCAFNMNQLSYEQEQGLDTRVKHSIKTKFIHWATFRANFGLAATMYWELLKRLKRLEALKGIANKYYGLR